MEFTITEIVQYYTTFLYIIWVAIVYGITKTFRSHGDSPQFCLAHLILGIGLPAPVVAFIVGL